MTGNYIKKRCVRSFILLLATTWAQGLDAQILSPVYRPNRPGIAANEQFNQEHYQLAAQSCRQYLAQPALNLPVMGSQNQELVRFQYVISLLQTNTTGCTDTAIAFAGTTLNDVYRQRVYFTVAQYYFANDKVAEAIPYYEKAGINGLSNSEIADAKFELAYGYFSNKQFDKAAPLFASIKEVKGGKYYVAGNYYYGLLSYNENKLSEALRSFERIRNEKEYKAVVPYYMAEISYFMGDRTQALKTAEEILAAKEKNHYDREVHLLAAQCYFEDQKYKEAKPYFEYYYEHSDKIRREDLYKIGYCYYRLGEWSNATTEFKLLSETKDTLGQSSMYLLGDCYLKTGDRKGARNAFGICSGMAFNKNQQEVAFIIYARLSYEAGYNDAATRSLNELLTLFPSTSYKDEVRTLLSALYIKSNDFEGALKYLEGVKSTDKMYHQVYQQAAYGYAVQLFRAGSLAESEKYFSASLQHKANEVYTASAYFWLSELALKLHHYNDAITNGRYFLDQKVSLADLERLSTLATAQHAWLNMGFAAMELQDLPAAQNYFEQAQQIKNDDKQSATLAALQEADAVFLQKNYGKAILLYDRIANTDTVNADYARYQKSIIYGLQGKNKDKIAVLLTLIQKIPASAYQMAARYETAVTNMETDHYPEALQQLRYLTDTATDRSLAPKAWLKTGFIAQQTNDFATAIESYKKVVVNFPASDERMAALEALKSLYIQTNQPGAFAALLKETGLPPAESATIDSTYYAAAEAQFATGKWDNALQGFTQYLNEFPNGVFAVKAHYYRGQSSFQLRKYPDALADFEKVLLVNWNDFSENSALHAAAISYQAKEYGAAYNYYFKLRLHSGSKPPAPTVFAGLMKSAFMGAQYDNADQYADTLLRQPDITGEMINEGLLYKAKASQQKGQNDTALVLFRQLSDNNNGEIAAESRYRVAEILLAKDSLADAETAANDAIKLSSGYERWIVKSYLVLADVLAKGKDYFNAKATLNSIIKNTKDPDLKAEASSKLVAIKAQEKEKTKLKEE